VFLVDLKVISIFKLKGSYGCSNGLGQSIWGQWRFPNTHNKEITQFCSKVACEIEKM